jgi:hypothetical protein
MAKDPETAGEGNEEGEAEEGETNVKEGEKA